MVASLCVGVGIAVGHAASRWHAPAAAEVDARRDDLAATAARDRCAPPPVTCCVRRDVDVDVLVPANVLKHGRLYGELSQLLLSDPERVTEDPTSAFELMVRLADETGLLAVQPENGVRELWPEPEAPELYLSLETGEAAGREWLRLSASLDLRVVLDLRRGPDGEVALLFSARGDPFVNRSGIEWSEQGNRDGLLQQRAPLGDLVDDLFQKLKSRTR